MCGAPYPTRFLADCLRGRRLVPVERAVQLMTSEPAALFGLRDRGVLRPGAVADVVVFDPLTVGSDDARLVADLPGGSSRLTAGSTGVVRVLVGGAAIVIDGQPTGAMPGVLLRSGVDTDTVTAR
jgi:N-acyl-D-aspartate/D-glutamate deacylase